MSFLHENHITLLGGSDGLTFRQVGGKIPSVTMAIFTQAVTFVRSIRMALSHLSSRAQRNWAGIPVRERAANLFLSSSSHKREQHPHQIGRRITRYLTRIRLFAITFRPSRMDGWRVNEQGNSLNNIKVSHTDLDNKKSGVRSVFWVMTTKIAFPFKQAGEPMEVILLHSENISQSGISSMFGALPGFLPLLLAPK